MRGVLHHAAAGQNDLAGELAGLGGLPALQLPEGGLSLPGEDVRNGAARRLDDALVNLDSERTKQAMALLSEIAKERQVILFTCKSIDA